MHQGTWKWHLKRCTSRYMFYICSKSQSDLWCKRWNLYLCIKMHIFICVWCCKVNEIIRITMSKFSISLWKHSGLHIQVLFYKTYDWLLILIFNVLSNLNIFLCPATLIYYGYSFNQISQDHYSHLLCRNVNINLIQAADRNYFILET